MDEISSQFPQPMDRARRLQPDDPIAEAGRKILEHQYRLIRFFERGVRTEEDIESLHKMRVAVRRMRIAYRVLRNYIAKEIIRSSIKELRELGGTLGDVRDLDVFQVNTEIYKNNLNRDNRISFSLIQEAFETKRVYHRKKLFELLDSQPYQDLCEGLSKLLSKPHTLEIEKMSQSSAYRTDFIAREIIRRRYEKILDFDHLTEKETIEKLHRLRIAVKAFRYSIEFFEEILGSEARYVIEKLIRLQDYLGELNDVSVATKMMENILYQNNFFEEHNNNVNSEATSYLEYLRDDVKIRIERFPSVLEIVHQSTFTSAIDGLISL